MYCTRITIKKHFWSFGVVISALFSLRVFIGSNSYIALFDWYTENTFQSENNGFTYVPSVVRGEATQCPLAR